MNKDSVLARKNELDQQRLQTIANLNALTGAIQDCEYWLAEIGEEQKKADQQPGEPTTPHRFVDLFDKQAVEAYEAAHPDVRFVRRKKDPDEQELPPVEVEV